MFSHAQKILLATSVSLAALAATGATAGTGISKIEVETKLEALQDSNALALYPDIADDLTREVLKRVDTTNDPTAPKISIEIRRVSLDGDTFLPDSAEFNELEGFLSYQGGSREVVEVISLSAHSDTSQIPDGYISVAPSDEDFYNAMIMAFADRVIELVPEEDIKTGS